MPFESRKFEQPKKPEESEAEKSEPEKIEGETTAKFSAEEIVELFAERNKEKPLNPEEIEQLGGEMNEYVEGLKARIEEIKAELEKKINEKKKAELEFYKKRTKSYDFIGPFCSIFIIIKI